MKNHKWFFLLLFSFLPCYITAQPNHHWINIYGHIQRQGPVEGWLLHDMFNTADSGIAMCGWTLANNGMGNIWVIKTNNEGEVEWTRTYNDSHIYSGSLIETDEGDLLVGGSINAAVDQKDVFVIKIDGEGDEIWRHTYGGDRGDVCTALIELKEGNYVIGGRTYSFGDEWEGYLLMIEEDGDLIWEEHYDGDGDQLISAIRETEGGIVAAGDSNGDYWLMKANFEGELLWSRTYSRDDTVGANLEHAYALVSHPRGFALAGHSEDRYLWLLSVDRDGNRLWDNHYQVGNNPACYALARMDDNGFVLGGRSDTFVGCLMRTDEMGNLAWVKTYARPIRIDDIDHRMSVFTSVLNVDNSIIATGITRYGGGSLAGFLIKYVPEYSPPGIVRFSPSEREFDILIADSVLFSAYAEDLQEDSLFYLWTLDNDSVGADTSVTITFDELGDFIVQCTVSDGELADSIRWLVHVRELYISGISPDSTSLHIRRRTEVPFAVSVRAIEDEEPIHYIWELNGVDQDVDSDSLTHLFDRGGAFQLRAFAWRGEAIDSVMWNISVYAAIRNYWPRELELTVPTDSLVQFVVLPFNPQSDSLSILWELDGDSIAGDVEDVFFRWDSVGRHRLFARVRDGMEADSVEWAIDVVNPDWVADHTHHLPAALTLYPPSPNPFNSRTAVRYAVPSPQRVRLTLYDINGRLVHILVDEYKPSGEHTVVLNGRDLPAGMYFVRLAGADEVRMEKLVLVR